MFMYKIEIGKPIAAVVVTVEEAFVQSYYYFQDENVFDDSVDNSSDENGNFMRFIVRCRCISVVIVHINI